MPEQKVPQDVPAFESPEAEAAAIEKVVAEEHADTGPVLPHGLDDGEELVTVNVVKPCRFTHDDGKQEFFGVGEHDVPAHVADHWFFASHTDLPPPADIKPGTPEYIADQVAQRRREELLQAAAAQRKVDEAREVAIATDKAQPRSRRRLGPTRIEENTPVEEHELQLRVQHTEIAESHSQMHSAAKRAVVAERTQRPIDQEEEATAPVRERARLKSRTEDAVESIDAETAREVKS